MQRWLAFALGLALAAAAVYALRTAQLAEPVAGSEPPQTAPTSQESRVEGAAPLHSTIGDRSRRELEEILRRAGREEGSR